MTKILKNFWVIEGLDGAGTTTQLKMLEDDFNKNNRPVFITQEPTTNETGKFIRRILSGEVKTTQSTIAYMFATDRNDHLYNPEYGIIKHLENNETVISDRYFFSSLAYQTIGFDWERVNVLNEEFPFPEYVIFIDTPVEDCLNRINKRGNSKEIYEKLDYQKKVFENYQKCLINLPEGCKLIKVDGRLTREEIFSEIKKNIY